MIFKAQFGYRIIHLYLKMFLPRARIKTLKCIRCFLKEGA